MTWESLETWELENLLKLEKIIFRNEISSSDYFIKFWNGDTHSAVIISNMDKYQNQYPSEFWDRKLSQLSTLQKFKNL